ncbi:small nuclear ribonucleo [Chlorella sorokiniana]|uniref:Small nuclear ribonucleo n=1 Tax=Chlorella sorokiniana TaxID=3076 RepID=A0A2P6TW06_CHLSO|nr:small nuclear ribonucleo [Chlorella sorokiniana]|eukprot:PRW58249.1 small nuclear ribonucleo [Chlorella sorokiniana]
MSDQAAESGSGAQSRSTLAEQAAVLLHKRCRIRVKDGRLLVGEFTCLDKQGNIILTNTYEHMTLNGAHHEKLMGQVLVPAAHRTSCEFEALPADAAQLQQLLGAAQA